jgi:hypothetical protein
MKGMQRFFLYYKPYGLSGDLSVEFENCQARIAELVKIYYFLFIIGWKISVFTLNGC